MADKETILMLIDEMIEEAQEEPQWKAESALKCLKKELLKAQEPVKPELRMSKHGFRQWLVCGACGSKINTTTSKANYCSYCGRKVKWEYHWNRNGDERDENY